MAYLDLYCERLGPGLWAEPVNAVTNAAFFVAAWFLWRDAGRQGATAPESALLIALIVAIGVGSTVFHVLATAWAYWLDLVPILVFQITFLWSYARRVIGWPAAAAAAFAAAFLVVTLYSRQFPEVLNGSLTYAPAIVVLLALGAYHRMSGRPGPWLLAAAAGVFTVSLCLRTVDAAVCPALPVGTHFLWHLLNALVLYLCARAVCARFDDNGGQAHRTVHHGNPA